MIFYVEKRPATLVSMSANSNVVVVAVVVPWRLWTVVWLLWQGGWGMPMLSMFITGRMLRLLWIAQYQCMSRLYLPCSSGNHTCN